MSDQPLIEGVNAAFLGVTDPAAHIELLLWPTRLRGRRVRAAHRGEAAAIWGEGVARSG